MLLNLVFGQNPDLERLLDGAQGPLTMKKMIKIAELLPHGTPVKETKERARLLFLSTPQAELVSFYAIPDLREAIAVLLDEKWVESVMQQMTDRFEQILEKKEQLLLSRTENDLDALLAHGPVGYSLGLPCIEKLRKLNDLPKGYIRQSLQEKGIRVMESYGERVIAHYSFQLATNFSTYKNTLILLFGAKYTNQIRRNIVKLPLELQKLLRYVDERLDLLRNKKCTVGYCLPSQQILETIQNLCPRDYEDPYINEQMDIILNLYPEFHKLCARKIRENGFSRFDKALLLLFGSRNAKRINWTFSPY